MPHSCAVPGCDSATGRPVEGRAFHRFPLDPGRCHSWLRALNYPGYQGDIPPEEVKDLRVCSLHFTQDEFIKTEFDGDHQKMSLKATAVPSVLGEDARFDRVPPGGQAHVKAEQVFITAASSTTATRSIPAAPSSSEHGSLTETVTSDEGYSSITFDISEINFGSDEETCSDGGREEEEAKEEEIGGMKSCFDPDLGNDDMEPNSESDWEEDNVESLKSHRSIHQNSDEHLCKFCLESFKTRVDKLAHEATHFSGEKPYKYSDCAISFAQLKKARHLHLKTHRGPKKFKCPICSLEFTFIQKLNRHTVVHTGVKPFVCDVCDRSFNQAGHLKSHMRLHTGERPFQCQDCDKSFNHNVSLKSHMTRYHSQVYGSRQGGHTVEINLKRSKTKKDEIYTRDVEKTGAVPGFDQLKGLEKTKDTKDKDKRSTGRPKGRPKRNAGVPAANLAPALQEEAPEPNTGAETLERAALEDDESRRKDSDLTLDIKEEEAEKPTSKRKASGTLTSEEGEYDNDFDPVENKKRRKSGRCQNLKSKGKPRGRTKNPAIG